MIGPPIRNGLRRAALTIAAASASWSAYLWLFDGVSVRIAGIAVRSHDPVRPLLMALVALAMLVPIVGLEAAAGWARRVSRVAWARSHSIGRRIAQWERAGLLHHVAAAALVLLLLAVGVAYGSKAAGGSDSYGYLSEAQLWLTGRLSVPQPWVKDVPWPRADWTFSPLGYTPSHPPASDSGRYHASFDPFAIVPSYSPGLPMLMAAAQLAGGTCAPFVIVPLGGALLVLATYLLGLRIGSRWLGLMAAFLVATSPPFLMHHLVSMSDVPLAAALLLACWCVLGGTMRSAFGAALALAVAMLIRPNMAPLGLVFAAWLAWRIRQGAPHRRLHAWRAVVMLGGMASGLFATAVIYWNVYGSPFESGYGPASNYFAVSHVAANLWNYSVWFAQAQTVIPLLGLFALFVPVTALWRDTADRSVVPFLAMFVAVIVGEFLLYLVLDSSSYLRFLLPCYPFIMIGLVSTTLSFARRWPRLGQPIALTALALLGLYDLRTSYAEWRVFDQARGEAQFIDVAEQVRDATPVNSVVLSMQHSGNIRYFGGRMTLRWDELQADWLDRGVVWMAERGVRSYALLDPGEVEAMKVRFAGQALVATLDAPAVFHVGDKSFYDFARPPGSVVTTRIIPAPDRWQRCVAPAPIPTLAWTR